MLKQKQKKPENVSMDYKGKLRIWIMKFGF